MNVWGDRLRNEPGSGPDSERSVPSATENATLLSDDETPSGPDASKEARNLVPRMRFSVTRWGSGRSLDPFLKRNSAHELVEEDPPARTDNTPEETDELIRHKKLLIKKSGTEEKDGKKEDPTAEPEPKEDEDGEGEESEKEGEPKKDDESEEEEGEEKEKPPSATAVVRKGAVDAFNSITPSRGNHFSFFWSFVAAWFISPQVFVALADRAAIFFGASQPLSGPGEPSEWGFMNGPGVWFRGILETYWGGGEQGRLILLAAVGIFPILAAQVSDKVSSKIFPKILIWTGYGFSIFFICGISYFPVLGLHSWAELYLVTLFALSWWGFSFSRTVGPGPTKFLLRIPLASLVFGVVSYSPGALF